MEEDSTSETLQSTDIDNKALSTDFADTVEKAVYNSKLGHPSVNQHQKYQHSCGLMKATIQRTPQPLSDEIPFSPTTPSPNFPGHGIKHLKDHASGFKDHGSPSEVTFKGFEKEGAISMFSIKFKRANDQPDYKMHKSQAPPNGSSAHEMKSKKEGFNGTD